MKLSEELILGSTILKHVNYGEDSNSGHGCALQLIQAAVGNFCSPNYLELTQRVELRHPWTQHKVHFCPLKCIISTIPGLIMHLNDAHKWSLDKIIDWVIKKENEDERSSQRMDHSAEVGELQTR